MPWPGGGQREALTVLAGQFGQRAAGPGGRGHEPAPPAGAAASMGTTASP